MTTKRKSLCTLLLLLVVAIMPQRSMGQVFETRTGVDTLTLAERISFHTNVVDWALLVPNIGVEFDIKNTNWNRHAIGVSFKTRWQTNSTFKQRYFYTITEGRIYWRNYWRTRQINHANDIDPHKGFIDRLFSCRRTKVKHPRTTYYRGLYASASDYSYRLGKDGRQGKALSAGVTYGCIRPLYQFKSGNSLDLELGIDVGMIVTKTEKFSLDEDEKCYTRVTPSETKFVPFPVPTEARLALVYRLGKYPITKKYRWRADVDVAYADALRDRRDEEQKRRIDNENAAKVRREIEKDFWQTYDSIAAKNAVNNKARAAETQKLKAEADRLAAEKKRLEKENAAKEEKAKKAKKDEIVVKSDSIANDSTINNPAVNSPAVNDSTINNEVTEGTEQQVEQTAEQATEKEEQATEVTEQATETTENPEVDVKSEDASQTEETATTEETEQQEPTSDNKEKEESNEN